MITASRTLERAILVGAPSGGGTISASRTIERAVLSSDPLPSGALTASVTVTRRVFGSNTITLVLNGAPTGLVGVLTISVETALGDPIYPATTSGITEEPPDSGRYVAILPEFGAGTYFATWSDGLTEITVELTIIQPGFLETFRAQKPPARTDDTPWTTITILEGASRLGPFIEIETIPLDPVDEDPSDPEPRDVATGQAILTAGWYSLLWADDAGHQQMTDPRYASHVIHNTT